VVFVLVVRGKKKLVSDTEPNAAEGFLVFRFFVFVPHSFSCSTVDCFLRCIKVPFGWRFVRHIRLN
jgi:hypothetical protein